MNARQAKTGSRFGKLLRQHRLAGGLTQEELADLSGLSVRAIVNMESGNTVRPYRDSVRALADALDLATPERDQLTRASRLTTLPAQAPEEVREIPVPRQLPAAVADFTGRVTELAALTALLGGPVAHRSTSVVISAIGGTAGVGKTALAVHWARQVSDRFPDGQLYVNLRGYDPDQPVAAGEALAGFLAALGVPGPQIPAEAEDRAAVYRSVLAGRRVLVLLDNARDAEQVRPLLPGDPGCAAVVTSRDMLAGLFARDGARRVLLDALPPVDAVALLRALVGPRVDAEPDAAARLAGLCCHLPLALRVAAELAAARPALSLAALAGELDGEGRLDALEAGGDQATAVRAVFSWSYCHLSPPTARAFRLFGLQPCASLDSYAVAALTGTTRPAAARALAELTRASLIHQAGSGRSQMHDLLRSYAGELAAARDPEDDRREALTRLLDYYLQTVRGAAGILFPADAPAPGSVTGGACGPVVGDEHTARAWLDTERANLTAVAAFASEDGWPGHAIGMSAALFRYLDVAGFLADALVIHGAAARAAARANDRAAEAGAVINIGAVYLVQGRYPEAVQHFRRALDLSRQATSNPAELRALLNLGLTYFRMGAYPDGTAAYQEALNICAAAGDHAGEARALQRLGEAAMWQGRYRQAGVWLREAVEASHQADDQVCRIFALVSLGEVEVHQGHHLQGRRHLEDARMTAHQMGYAMVEADAVTALGLADLREGRHQEAAQGLQQALAAFHDAGVRTAEASVLCKLGELDLRLDQPAQASGRYRQALAIYRRIAEPPGEAQALNGLGEAACARLELSNARAHHQAALAIARAINIPEQQARAHEGLGNIGVAAGDVAEARLDWQHALTLYTDMDVPDARRIRAKLAATEDDRPPWAAALSTLMGVKTLTKRLHGIGPQSSAAGPVGRQKGRRGSQTAAALPQVTSRERAW